MSRLSEQIFVCLDCEMTGLDPTDFIIEVAAVKFCGEEVIDTFESLIDPKRPISPASIAIHHITDEMVAGKPTTMELLPKFFAFIGKNIIIGHGIGCDLAVLRETARRDGIAYPLDQNQIIDTLRMARLYGECPINSLKNLCIHFNVAHDDAHRALSDVLVNIKVFHHLAKKFRTTEKLLEELSTPIFMKAMPFGKHKGRLFKEIPQEYLQWAARKEFDQDLLYSIRTELKRRKQGNHFAQSGNPFSELR